MNNEQNITKKVIVAGAPGFLGTKLVEILLNKNRIVTCLVHPLMRGKLEEIFKNDSNKENLIIKYKDVLAPLIEIRGIVKGSHTFFNCAGVQHPAYTKDIYNVNSLGPVNLLKGCIEERVNNFIHISSSTVCGSNFKVKNNNAFKVVNEDSFTQGYTHYTRSKISGDNLLRQHSYEGTKVIILMPTVFYGTPPSANLNQLMKIISGGKSLPIITKKGMLRSYVDINRVIDVMLAAEERGKSGEHYIISDKTPLFTRQFYQCLATGLETKVKTIVLPLSLSRFSEKMALVAGKFNHHLKYLNVLGEFGRSHAVEVKKIEDVFGIKMHEDSENGLIDMAKYFNDNLK
jgi:nucleoside-diphosphate-sugar epimerase